MLSDEKRAEMFEKAYLITDKLKNEVGKVISGKERETELLICAMIAGGHVLIEDVPGVGKTTLATALAKAAGLSFRRAQFTPDVMASDITGFNVYNRKTESFEFREGLVNTNIFLADEINRASPKTQSSLLEAMEEMTVTVDGVTYDIPQPFIVIATQNPLGFVGTFPLPEAQIDRFSLRISMGYPDKEQELSILRNRKNADPMKSIEPLPDASYILACKKVAENVFVSESVEKYIIELVTATRNRTEFELGASPRASLALMKLSRALALMNHRDFVRPEDVASLYINVLSHRVVLSNDAVASGTKTSDVLQSILKSTAVPFANGSRSK